MQIELVVACSVDVFRHEWRQTNLGRIVVVITCYAHVNLVFRCYLSANGKIACETAHLVVAPAFLVLIVHACAVVERTEEFSSEIESCVEVFITTIRQSRIEAGFSHRCFSNDVDNTTYSRRTIQH